MTPIFLFFVERSASSTPGTTTPKIGTSKASLMASMLLEDAVLQATMMAFTPLLSRKRTFCLEYFVTASLDFVP